MRIKRPSNEKCFNAPWYRICVFLAFFSKHCNTVYSNIFDNRINQRFVFCSLFITFPSFRPTISVMSDKENCFVGSVGTVSSNFRAAPTELWHQFFEKESLIFLDGNDVRVADRDAHLSIVIAGAVLKTHSWTAESLLLHVDRRCSFNTQKECFQSVAPRLWIDLIDLIWCTNYFRSLNISVPITDAWYLPNVFYI